jgi:hypothetical protein
MLNLLFLTVSHAALRGSNQSQLSHPIGRGVSVPAIMEHLEAFSAAADVGHGNRAVGPGYNASADYVVASLEKLGDFYDITKQHFTAPIYVEQAAPHLEILGMEPALSLDRCEQTTGWQHYYVGCDYAGVRYGGSGEYDVTAEVTFVSDACTSEGWASFPKGNIALVEAATSACDYYTRGINAEEAGAGAVIFTSVAGSNTIPGSRVYDSANWPHKLVTTPCIGVTHAIGNLLKQSGTRANVKTNTKVDVVYTYNVIAESKNGNPKHAVMMGSHLDSVPEGPGLNDNGSGSASTLEIAIEWAHKQMKLMKSTNAKVVAAQMSQPNVRFGWWGAEEIGLIGSRYYVDQLVANPVELEKLACYLNYDMEAGPNYVRMVHDASTAPVASTIAASTILQNMYEQAWEEAGLTFSLTGMRGGSDFLPFNLAGIPTGGLATGASGKKTMAERAKHGGLALTQLDPCYHAPCDTIENIDQTCLKETSQVSSTVLERLVHGHRGGAAGDGVAPLAQITAADKAASTKRRQQQYAALKNDPEIKKRFNDDCNALDEEAEAEGAQEGAHTSATR